MRLSVDGVVKATVAANTPRPDVGAAFPGVGSSHGFDSAVAGPLAAGSHQLCVTIVGVLGGPATHDLGCRTLVIAAPAGG